MQQNLQGIRLSPQQKHLWMLQGDHRPREAHCSVVLEGPLNVATLEAAMQSVVGQYEIFRTTFHRESGVKVPFQVIHDSCELSWHHLDLSHLAVEQHEQELRRLIDEQQIWPFDFETLPHLCLRLAKFSLRKHALLIRLPALCADAWTIRNLIRQLSSTYQAGCEGRECSSDPVQYVQFSEWQNELLTDKDVKAGQTYWHGQDFRSSPPLVLPFERPETNHTQPRRQEHCRDLDPSVVEILTSMALQSQSPIASMLLGAWYALLWKLTGKQELVVATLCEGRPYEELEESMGLFAKWLPVRYRVSPDSRWHEVVSQVDDLVNEGKSWQEHFVWDDDDEIMETLEENLFGFSYEPCPDASIAGGVTFLLHRHGACFDRFKMKLSCTHGSGSLRMTFTYDPDRFSRLAVQCLSEQFEVLLASVFGQPDARLNTLSILSESARRRVLVDFNETSWSGPSQVCLHELFEAQCAKDPTRVAVVCQDESLTYAELNGRANRVARYLRRHGVGPLTLVGLWVERSVEMVVGLLGILKAGASYVPLDPGAPVARLHSLLKQIDVSWLVTQQALLSQELGFNGTILCLDRDRSLLDNELPENLGRLVSPHALAYVIYTSGSTGAPKGVAVTHHNIVNYTSSVSQILSMEAGWGFATVSTLSADLGNTVVFPSLTSGGTLHIIPYETAMNGNMLADYFTSHQIDVLKVVPSHFQALLRSTDGVTFMPKKYLIFGGEVLSVELANWVIARSNGCSVVNHYGPTETTIGSLLFPLSPGSNEGFRWSSTVPIGRPLGNTQAFIMDERLEPVAVGVPGELYIAGMGVAWGYLHQPAQTAERFLPHPYSAEPGARWYRTGDLARLTPDDTIEFLGRRDQQIKLRGFRIELGEIEAHLGQAPGVREGVVMVREDASNEKSLMAYVVASGESALTFSIIRDYLKDRLPDYMVPRTVVFLDSFPLTPNGKVDRKALLAFDGERLTAEYVAPRNPIETLLAEIWAELLKRERIGIYENFFDMGGHSLLAVQLLHRIQKAIGSELSLMTVFQSPTVASLADVVINALRVPSSPLIALKAEGSRRPLYCIDSTGNHVFAYQPLARSLSVGQPVYGVELHNVFTLSPKAISIQALAKDYAHAIHQHQPEGPYQVLGWSLGGVIGLAIAHELEALGQSVAFLGFLDTQTRSVLYETSRPSLLEELAGFLEPESREELRALPDNERQALQDRLLTLQPEEQINAMILWAQAQRYFDADVPLEVIKSRYALLKDEARLMKTYRYRPIHAPIHVWWATKTLEREAGIPPIDWTSYTTGLVHTEIIESDHDGLLGNPRVHRQIDEILTKLA
ncbi:non-ribosomal peptide synthetase [Nitrospira sp. Ecomares 2.1]